MDRPKGIYTPRDVPREKERLAQFLVQELRNIADAQFGAYPTWWLAPQARYPAKPRKGMLAYFDGTNVDPGSGEGVYVYKGSSWVFLG